MPDRRLTLVVCAAPLASRTADIAAATVAGGWVTSVVATPDPIVTGFDPQWLVEALAATACGRLARGAEA